MKAKINYERKLINVYAPGVAGAGWCGFEFAAKHPDLVEVGWRLHYYPETDTEAAAEYVTASLGVDMATKLGILIRRGPPKPRYEQTNVCGERLVVEPSDGFTRPHVAITTTGVDGEVHPFVLPVDEVVAAVRGEVM